MQVTAAWVGLHDAAVGCAGIGPGHQAQGPGLPSLRQASGAMAQSLPWRPTSSGRNCTESTPLGSLTLVPAGISPPLGRALLPSSMTMLLFTLARCTCGSGTPLGQVMDRSWVPWVNSVPASRRVPATRVRGSPSRVPAANSRLPEASRIAAASTVPAGSTRVWSRVAVTGRRVPAATVSPLIGRS